MDKKSGDTFRNKSKRENTMAAVIKNEIVKQLSPPQEEDKDHVPTDDQTRAYTMTLINDQTPSPRQGSSISGTPGTD